MATENLLMAAVQAGGDRQDLHERIRIHSLAAAAAAQGGGRRQRPDRPAPRDPAFPRSTSTGCWTRAGSSAASPEQVDEFVAREVEPIRRRYPDAARGRSRADEIRRADARSTGRRTEPRSDPGRSGAGEPCGAASAPRGGGARWASRSRPCAAFPCEAHCARRACGSGGPPPGSTRRNEPVTSPQAVLSFLSRDRRE